MSDIDMRYEEYPEPEYTGEQLAAEREDYENCPACREYEESTPCGCTCGTCAECGVNASCADYSEYYLRDLQAL